MDNLTHSLAGALLGQMGLKRSSRLAMAGCILGANAPDIDVFAPFFLPVDNIAFHRGPTHAIWGWPVMALGVVGLLWLYNRLRPGDEGSLPFRAGPLFVTTFLAVLTHPFLDWLTTYAIALLAPVGSRWYSANAIFIIDWVYWIFLVTGIWWSQRRYKANRADAARPAQFMGGLLLLYIAGNVAWSAVAERATAEALRRRGIEPRLIVTSPPPLAFWSRTIAWRDNTHWGRGRFVPGRGLLLDSAITPLNLDHPALREAIRTRRDVRSFLYWSRMPFVSVENGRVVLKDQRYATSLRRSAGRTVGSYDPFTVELSPEPKGE